MPSACLVVIGFLFLAAGTHGSVNYKDVCGRAFQKPKRVQDKVITGEATHNGDWPWVVATGGCTASLVSPNYVISALHCYINEKNDSYWEYVPDTQWKGQIWVGSVDSDVNATVFDVQAIHYVNTSIPAFEAVTRWGLDIVVVKLNKSVEFSPTASPICLSDARLENHTIYVVNVGWGVTYTDDGQKHETHIAREQILPLLTSRPPMRVMKYTPVETIVGDSGGPIQFELNKRWHLAGITSRGYQGPAPDLDAWNVYPRISRHCDWIAKVTEGEVVCEKST
ncbi:Enteropeptidase [Aphelenchoides avenae]|nr:Enteropeptidase [Aphelenchus avenae]